MTKLTLIVLLLVRAGIAMAFPNEPNGFGKARLGMTVEQAQKALPEMKPSRIPPEGGPALLAIYRADNQSIYGLKPCQMDLYFDPQQLYQISFDCGRGEKVVAALQKKFGNPTEISERGAFWRGEHTTVSLNTKARTFAFVDRALNDGVQTRLYVYVMTHQGETEAAAVQAPPVQAPAAQAELTPVPTPQ
jgi:hypothetical protein